MNNIRIALAQSASRRGQVEENLQKHQLFIETAAENGAQLIVFPELSLTGYEPELALQLAFILDDERLNLLKELASKHQMIILAGAPLRTKEGLYIAAFILYPNKKVSVYTKHYLHPGEEKVFLPGALNPSIQLQKENIAIAVCADIANPQHAGEAARINSSIYLASAFITPGGYEKDTHILKGYARQYSMPVMMANYSGHSGGFESAGRTAAWSADGKLISELKDSAEGLLLLSKEESQWKGYIPKLKDATK